MSKSKGKVRIKYKGRLILLILIVILIIYLFIKGILFTIGLVVGDGLKFDKVNSIDAKRTEDNNVSIATNINKEALVVGSDKEATLYDKEGKKIWSIDADFKDIRIGKEMIIGSTNEEGSYIVLDYNGQEIYRSNIGYNISDIKINNIDYSILMHTKGFVLVDNTGEEVTRVNIEDGQVMDVEFQDGNQGILLDVVSVNNDGYDTNIITYNYQGNVLSGKTIKDRSCFNIDGIAKDRVLVLSDIIQVLDSDRNVSVKKEFEGDVTRLEVYEKEGSEDFNIYVSIVNDNETDIAVDPKSAFVVKALNPEMKEIFNTEIPGEVKGIRPAEDKIIVYSARTIFVIDEKGKVILEKEINKDIIDVKWLTVDRVLIIDKTGITIVTLDNGRK